MRKTREEENARSTTKSPEQNYEKKAREVKYARRKTSPHVKYYAQITREDINARSITKQPAQIYAQITREVPNARKKVKP